MTIKQRQILTAASQLFAEEGFHAISTSKIAKKANVSEGLVFRHFKNKEGLVEAILKEGEVRIKKLFIPIINEEDTKQVLRKTLELPFDIKETEFDFWKLQFKLKWELDYDSSSNIKPLKEKLIEAFTILRYKKPKFEADLIIHILDGLFASILKGRIENESEFKSFIMNKYHI